LLASGGVERGIRDRPAGRDRLTRRPAVRFAVADQVEATLDVTWSGAIATNATINFVISASTNTTDGVDLSELYIIDNNLTDVMTESFGACEAAFTQSQATTIAQLAEQAAAEGTGEHTIDHTLQAMFEGLQAHRRD